MGSTVLGMFSSNRLYTDWKIAKPDEAEPKAAKLE